MELTHARLAEEFFFYQLCSGLCALQSHASGISPGDESGACFRSRNFPARPSARKAVSSVCCAVLFQGRTPSTPSLLSLLHGHLFVTVSNKEEMVLGTLRSTALLLEGFFKHIEHEFGG